ncbi:MAG: hypothetical protein E5W38_11900, partial [Mesorhizobium sp.]
AVRLGYPSRRSASSAPCASIAARMIELAKIWTAAHPTRGRPKKLSDQGLRVTSSKRATLKGDPRPSMKKAGVAA